MLPASPPVDFPLYGLDHWDGPRWLDSFDGELGTPTWGVRLGHQRGTDTYVGVATHPRERFDRLCAAGRDPLAEVAFHGNVWLVDLTLPSLQPPRPDGFLRVLVEHAEAQAARYAEWPSVRWSVGDASVWRWAGGWAGFAVLDGAYLSVAGFGVEPDGLTFSVVPDGAPYGFDLAAPLRNTDLRVARERTGPADAALCDTDAWHADQAALMAAR